MNFSNTELRELTALFIPLLESGVHRVQLLEYVQKFALMISAKDRQSALVGLGTMFALVKSTTLMECLLEKVSQAFLLG